MEDKFEKYLAENIKSLPEIDHDETLWGKIADELDFEEKLLQISKTLPVHEHREDLWDNIQIKDVNRLNHKRLVYLSGIAASIILFIASYKIFNNPKDFTINYSTEVVYNSEQVSVENNNNQSIDKMLQQLCKYSTINCSSPDVIRIKNQLSELDAEILRLNQVIKSYGGSPELIKCLIKMENQKSELINEFIKKSET